MMYVLFTILGIIIGAMIRTMFYNSELIHGVIDVDHNTKLCRFHISSQEISNYETKTVKFLVNHNAKLEMDTRDEHTLQ